ncbi:hypothetical protein T439DRAFT_383400 [Meredithblackwellia eburnea MCA 4105]
MSASLVAAAAAGIFVGVGATLALKPSQAPPPPTRRDPAAGGAPPQRIDTSPVLAGPSGSPSTVYHGGLTGTELARAFMAPGQIGPVSDFLRRKAYVAAYDRRNRIPAWTAEHLTAESLRRPEGAEKGDRQNSVFSEDASVPEMFRARLLDYFKSGYDRGHMVPAADAKISQEAMNETFLLTNIAPQVGEGFNRHYWAYVEAFCRNLTQSFEDVYVFTVPLFLPKQSPDGKWRVSYEMIAPQNSAPTIAVPTHFAKVILSSRPPRSGSSLALVKSSNNPPEKEWSMGAFVLPNEVIPDETDLRSFVVPVEAVESSAGLTLLPERLKKMARPLCQTVECKVIVRRFDDANKKFGGGGGGGGKGGRGRSATL